LSVLDPDDTGRRVRLAWVAAGVDCAQARPPSGGRRDGSWLGRAGVRDPLARRVRVGVRAPRGNEGGRPVIVIITLLYFALIWLVYFKLKLLPFTLANKIGVALAGVILVFGLVLATNYSHPHSSDVRVFRYTIPISTYLPKPAQVVEVPVQPNVPVKKGEVLFRVDPRPYEYEVKRLEAALVAANTDLPKLEAELKVAQAAVTTAEASLANVKGDFDRAERERVSGAVSESEYLNTKTRYDNAASVRR